MAKKNKTIWIVLGVAALLLLVFSGRQVKTDFSRTFSAHNVRPGDDIIVEYTAINLAPDDPWIGEMPLPDGYTWSPLPITATNIELTQGRQIRFYGIGNTQVRFIITPTTRGQEVIDGWIYHPRDDVTYLWGLSGYDYVSDIVTTSCITNQELLGYLLDWLRETITLEEMLGHIRNWMTNPCPA